MNEMPRGSHPEGTPVGPNRVAEMIEGITQVPKLYQILYAPKGDCTVKYIGNVCRFSAESIGIIGSTDPSRKYVEMIINKPDTDQKRILERQDIIRNLLPLDFIGVKTHFDEGVGAYDHLRECEKKYFDPEASIEEKEEALAGGVESFSHFMQEMTKGITCLGNIKHEGIREIYRGISLLFARTFPDNPHDVCKTTKEKCFTYMSIMQGLMEEVLKIRGIILVLNYIKHFEMESVTFTEEDVGYSDARSVFAEKEQNVVATSFPDIPLIFLRAPNGSGKTFAETRDMAIQILGQSIGYVPAKNPRLRIYDVVWIQSRLQSVQHTDGDLSALGVEGKSLDQLYDAISDSSGKSVLVFLDETGATTDEKSEFRMMRDFVDAITNLAPNARVRFSTHNQLLIDEMRHRGDKSIGFYTFTHDHILEVGERNSDTINSMGHMFDEWDREINEYYTAQYGHIRHDLSKFLEKLAQVKISSWEKNKTKDIVLPAWKSFYNIIQVLITELEQLESTGQLPDRKIDTGVHIHSSIAFSEHVKGILSSRSKGLHDGIFPSTNQRFDYQIATVKHPYWSTQRTTMIGRRTRGFHFYEDTNYGESDGREDPFKSARKRDETEYESPKIGYSNSGSWYRIGGGTERVARLVSRTNDDEDVRRMIHEIFNDHAGRNIPLTQEKRDMLIEIGENPELRDKLKKHGEFLADLIHTFIFLRFELEKDFVYTGEKHEKPFLSKYLRSLTVVENDNSYEKETECMRFLKNEGRDYIYRSDFPHALMLWYENIRTLFLLAGGDVKHIGQLDQNAREYHALRVLGKREILLHEDASVISLVKDIKSDLLQLVEQVIPKLISEGGDMTLSQFFQGDFRHCFIEMEGVERREESVRSFSLRFFEKQKHDTTSHLIEFLSTLEKFQSPLLQGIAHYYRDILGFSLGSVENIPSLIPYYVRYVEELGPKGFHPFTTLQDDGKDGEKKYRDYNQHLCYVDDPTIPNMTGDLGFWHINMRAVAYDIKELLSIIGFGEFLKDEGLVPVVFHEGKGLEISQMMNQDVDRERVLLPNSVSLTPSCPIEIIEGCNSSGKTEYIRNVLKALNQSLNIGHVNAKSLKLGNLEEYAYMDRLSNNQSHTDLSSGQQDILSWVMLLKVAEKCDFLIVEADEIFSTMDAHFTSLFAQVFIGRLRDMGKYAIIVTHNHDFARKFGTLPGVQVNHFHSDLLPDGSVHHTYEKRPGGIDDSHGVEVLKSLGIGKRWLR